MIVRSFSASYATRVYMRSRSCSHDTPSFYNFPVPMMVRPSSTMVCVYRCEKPGASRHHVKILSCRLTSYRRETPRSSKVSIEYSLQNRHCQKLRYPWESADHQSPSA